MKIYKFINLLNEKALKGYSLTMMPKIGDKVEMKTPHGGVQGTVYQVATGGHTFKLEDEYGNKNKKDFNTKDFKKAKIIRKEIKEANQELWGQQHNIHEYMRVFQDFVKYLTKTGKAYYKKNLKNLTWQEYEVKPGKRFDKIVRENSVYCFVEKGTGDIYKAATFRAPAKGVRANIFDKDSFKKADMYGRWLYRRG